MGALPPWKPFEACSAATRARLEAAIEPASYSPGDPLITVGQLPGHITVLADGVMRVFHSRPGEEGQFTVKLLRAPVAVGLVEVLRESPWEASVEALTPLSGGRLPAEALRAAVRDDHAFAAALLDDVCAKFEGTMRAARSIGFDDCETRLTRVLLEYAAHFGREDGGAMVIRHPLSRERLAREIGAARRSVDRALEKLAREGLVELSPKGWQVLKDPGALRARLERAP